MSRVRWLWSACLFAVAQPSAVAAHGRFPVATSLSFAGDAGDTLLLATSFGLLVREAGEPTFHWRCPELLGLQAGLELTVQPYDLAWSVQQNGLHRASSDLFCTLEPLEVADADSPAPPTDVPEESFAVLPLATSARQPLLRFFNVRTPSGDRLWRSSDGGQTYEERLRFAGAILALTDDLDARQIWVGGDRDGLWYSGDGGETFAQLGRERQVTCLAYRAPLLWLCEAAPTAPFQLGHSADGGEEFTPVLHFGELTFDVGCGEPQAQRCAAQWRDDVERDLSVFRAARSTTETPDAGLLVDASLPAPDAAPAALDAGTPTPSAPSGCSAQHGSRPDPLSGALALLLVSATWRGARAAARRRPRTRPPA